MRQPNVIMICIIGSVLALQQFANSARACRVNSDILKSHAKKFIERLLSPENLEPIYWPDEPLPSYSLSKAIGINITYAETHFQVAGRNPPPASANAIDHSTSSNEVVSKSKKTHASSSSPSLIQDIFVHCSVSRDRSYSLTINLELDNPFKEIDIHYDIPLSVQEEMQKVKSGEATKIRTRGEFRMHLPQSTLLVQLSQRIRYDECLTINYVQLAPSVSYEIDCPRCDDIERAHLDKLFNRRMTQFDAEFDSILGERLLFGLQTLLSQQRLDLDLYMD